MTNDTVGADAIALPKTRRLFLIGGTATALLATLKGAAAAGVNDGKVLAHAAEVERLVSIANGIQETRILPFENEFEDRMHARGVTSYSMEDAFEFSRQCGREDAIEEQHEVDAEADRVFRALIAVPATTQAGRAAKVRAFLQHVGRSKWCGPADDLDWDIDMARALLQEFAGMSAEEIANV